MRWSTAGPAVHGAWRVIHTTFAMLVLGTAGVAQAQVAFTTAASAQTGVSNTLTYALTIPAGANRLLIVSAQIGSNCASSTPTVTGVTYAGVALTRITSIVGTPCGPAATRSEQWRLIAPATGTNDVVVTLSAIPDSLHSGAMAFAGVDQAAPVRAFASASGTGLSSFVSVTSAIGDLVVNTVGQGGSVTAPGGGQTQRFLFNWSSSTTLDNSAGSTAPGAASVAMTWTFGSSDEWQTMSSSLRPARQLAFTTPARTLTAGGCPGAAGAITVQLQDGVGNPVTAGAGGQAFTASSSSTGTVTWFTDSACTTTAAGGGFTIPNGASTVSLYYRDTRAGSPSVSLANGSGVANPSPQVHTVNAGVLSSFLVEAAGASGNWYGGAWTHRRRITIDNTRVGPGGVADFPFVVSLPADADLSSNARPDGFDMLFTAADGMTKLSHEVERYSSATGELVAWVKAPSVSSAAPTDTYLYYGNPGATDQQNAVSVWSNGYGGVWHLRETTGGAGAIKDSTSNANHGTDGNSPALGAPGKLAGAIEFDGVNDDVVIGDYSALEFTNGTQGAVSFWMKVNAYPTLGDGIIVDKYDSSVGYGGYFFRMKDVDTDGTLDDLRLFVHGTANCNGCGAGPNLLNVPLGQWLHVVSTIDLIAGSTGFYVDGSLVMNEAGIYGELVSANALTLARASGGSFAFFSGAIDEVRVSNVARSAAWITTEYNNQNSPSTFYSVGAPETVGGGPIGTQTAGTPFSIKVTARDSNNNTVAGFTGTVDLASTGILLAGGGTTATFTAGVLISTGVTISSAGTFTITATRTAGAEAGTSNAFLVNAGAFAKLQLLVPGETAAPGTASGKTGTPSAQTAGSAFAVTVRAVDAYWNLVSSTDTVGLSSSDAIATLPANAALAAGSQNFSVTLKTAGTATVSASDITNGTKPANTSPSIAVNAAAASRLAFTTPPRTFTAGTCPGAAGAITVQLQDAFGNAVSAGAGGQAVTASSTSTGTVTWYTDSACSATAAGGTFTIPSGASTASVFYRDTRAGAPSVNLTNGSSLANPASQLHAVNAGLASKLAVSAVSGSTTAGSSIAPDIVVTVQDAFGNTVTSSSASITAAIGANPGGGTLFGASPVAAVAGIATFSNLSIDKAGVGYTLTVSSGGLAGATSGTFNIVPATASKLAFTVQPATTGAGAALAPTVTVQDAFGNTVTSSSASVSIAIGTNPGGGVLSGTNPKSAASGVAAFADLFIDKVGVGYTLTAASGGLTGATSIGFNIGPGAATRLAFTVQPLDTAAGAAITPTVTVQDAYGNTVSTATPIITVAIGANPGGGVLSGTSPKGAVAGAASFADLSIDMAGVGYTLTASASGLAGATSSTFDIAVLAASKVAFAFQPTNSTAGAGITPAVVVEVQDALGNVVGSASSSITLAIGTNPGGGTLGGTVTVSAVNGVATFSTLNIDKVGVGYTLAASASGLAGATSVSFDIMTGVAAKLAFSVQPTSAGAGATIAPAVVVVVQDSLGNAMSSSAASISLVLGSNPGGGTLSGTSAANAVGGTAAFGGLSLDRAGVGYTLVASSAGLAGAASVAFDISVAAPAKLAFTAQPVSTAAGAALTPSVEVQDAFGNRVIASTPSVTVALGANPGGSVLSGTTTVVVAGGVSAFSNLALDKAGAGYTLVASSAGLAGATSAAFDIVAGAPVQLAFLVQPASATAGATLTPSVVVQDAFGNLVSGSGAGVTAAIGTNPGGGTLSGTNPVAAVGGVATFSDLSVDKAGAGYTLVAAASGLIGATSAAFDVTAGAAAQLAFLAQPPSALAGAVLSPAVQVAVLDPLGNALPSSTASIALALGSNPGGGVLSGTNPESAVGGVAAFPGLSVDKVGTGYTLVASSAGLASATSAPFDISLAAVAKLAFLVQPSALVAGGVVSPAVQVAVQDAFGNTDSSSTAGVSIVLGNNPGGGVLQGVGAASAVGGVATFADLTLDRVGAGYSLVASSPGLVDATSAAFAVTAGPAAKLAFVLQPSSAAAGAPLSASVLVLDAPGNLVSSSGADVVLAIGSNPGAGALSGTSMVAAAGGIAAFTGLSINRPGAGYTLTASSSGLTGATSTAFDISAGGAARLAFVVNPVTAVAGAPLAPVVAVAIQDSAGNIVASSTTSVAVGLGANPGNAVLGGAGAAAANAGIATFADLSLDKAGVGYTLTASAPGLGTATSAAFDITAGAVERLAFTVQPPDGVQGTPLLPAVQVAVQDALGNTVPGIPVTIALSLEDNPGLATLSGITSAGTVDGVATFADLSLDRRGAGYRFRAYSEGMGDVQSDAFEIVPQPKKEYLLGCSCQSEGGSGLGIWGFFGLVVLAHQVTRSRNFRRSAPRGAAGLLRLAPCPAWRMSPAGAPSTCPAREDRRLSRLEAGSLSLERLSVVALPGRGR